MILKDAAINVLYRVTSIDLPEEAIRHLSNLGLKLGSLVKLISKSGTSAIVMLKSSRLAFDYSVLEKIEVRAENGELETVPLSELKVGDYAYIDTIFAEKETKRHLMDMGLTRHTKIFLRKHAPLGDPIEISLRGYELTLRKSEASMISVIKEKEGVDE